MTPTHKPPYSSFNKWFLIPFFAWCILGGLALLAFDKETLFAAVNTRHSPVADTLMAWITRIGEGVIGGVILLLLLLKRSFRNWWYFSAALLCNVIPALVVQLVKNMFNAPRPLNYFKEAAWIHHLPAWEKLMERSFPSGHTAAAFCLFAFLSFILTPKYKWAGAAFFIVGLLVGYSRIYLAAHFFLDVYVGSVFGVLFTILVVAIMRKYPHSFYRNRTN